LEVVTNWC